MIGLFEQEKHRIVLKLPKSCIILQLPQSCACQVSIAGFICRSPLSDAVRYGGPSCVHQSCASAFSVTMTSETEDVPSKAHLTPNDYNIIVTWAENPKNYEAIHGTGGKTAVDGKPKSTKMEGFRQMAEHLHRMSKTPGLPLLTPYNMQQRWKTYKKSSKTR